jgi:hypothetical protein
MMAGAAQVVIEANDLSMIVQSRIFINWCLVVGGIVLFLFGFALIAAGARGTFRAAVNRESFAASLGSNSPGLLFVALGAFVFWLAAEMRLVVHPTETVIEIAPPPSAAGRDAASAPPSAPPTGVDGAGAPPVSRPSGAARPAEDGVAALTRVTIRSGGYEYAGGRPDTKARIIEALGLALTSLSEERTRLLGGTDEGAIDGNRLAVETLRLVKHRLENDRAN